MTTKTKNITDCKPDDTSRANFPNGVTIKPDPAHLKNAARRTYADQKNQPISDEQITNLLPMVHKIVQKVVTYTKPPLSYEDLVSAGTFGLVKAAHDYKPNRQAEFKTYAYIRIRGAILDELRKWSFVPANVDKQINRAVQISIGITEETGSAPTDAELAGELEITVEKLYEIFDKARAKHFLSIDASNDGDLPLGSSLASDKTATPVQKIERNELVEKLAEAIRQLDERQRQIILLYYHQQLTMKQIAAVFKITEPRVSQLHANALFNLSIKLRRWKDGGE